MGVGQSRYLAPHGAELPHRSQSCPTTDVLSTPTETQMALSAVGDVYDGLLTRVPGGASARAIPSAIWLRALFPMHRKRMPRTLVEKLLKQAV